MTDVEGVRNIIGTGLVQLFGGTLTAIISLVLLINISAKMTAFVLIPVVIFGLVSHESIRCIFDLFLEKEAKLMLK